MNECADPEPGYTVAHTREMDSETMVEEMGLSPGDTVRPAEDESRGAVRRVDSVGLGRIHFHHPLVSHPQDARYGGRAAFDQPVAEWYAAWRRGELVPAQLTVEA